MSGKRGLFYLRVHDQKLVILAIKQIKTSVRNSLRGIQQHSVIDEAQFLFARRGEKIKLKKWHLARKMP